MKRVHRIRGIVGLAEATDLTRKTWSTALRDQRPTPQILAALARLGARPDRILIVDEVAAGIPA
ncbi:XRE family transcriptional regulator [Rhodococcus jostii]|uniref:XRE family transcriptional regulator n=1 Tax=Rhodococcus jostii TaxID=132919 RepID=UPI003642B225